MVVCVKMMSKGSKEALTVLIVTHVTHVKKVKSGVRGYVHNIDTFNVMLKGSKEALTVLIVTHVTHIKRVEKVWNVWNDVKGVERTLTVLIVSHVTHVKRVERLHYVHNIHLMLCLKGRKIMLYVETRDKHIFAHNFLNIQLIFNPQKVLESWDLVLSNHTIKCYVCWRMSKGSKVKITFDPFDIHSIGWYFWKGLSLSFPKLLRIENRLNIKKVMSKNVFFSLVSTYNIIFRPFRHSIKCIYIVYII